MPIVRWLALACFASGCGVHLEDRTGVGADDTMTIPGDARAADPGGDAAPLCSNGRVVYLNFDGQALTQQLSGSDATQNRASWMTIATGTAPKYKAAAADRLQQIKDVTDGVRAQL